MFKAIRQWFEVQVWGWRAIWRHLSGRWHFFRDAPHHVVFSIAATPDHPDSDIQAIIDAARAEKALREQRLRREIEDLHKAILEALQPPKG